MQPNRYPLHDRDPQALDAARRLDQTFRPIVSNLNPGNDLWNGSLSALSSSGASVTPYTSSISIESDLSSLGSPHVQGHTLLNPHAKSFVPPFLRDTSSDANTDPEYASSALDDSDNAQTDDTSPDTVSDDMSQGSAASSVSDISTSDQVTPLSLDYPTTFASPGSPGRQRPITPIDSPHKAPRPKDFHSAKPHYVYVHEGAYRYSKALLQKQFSSFLHESLGEAYDPKTHQLLKNSPSELFNLLCINTHSTFCDRNQGENYQALHCLTQCCSIKTRAVGSSVIFVRNPRQVPKYNKPYYMFARTSEVSDSQVDYCIDCAPKEVDALCASIEKIYASVKYDPPASLEEVAQQSDTTVSSPLTPISKSGRFSSGFATPKSAFSTPLQSKSSSKKTRKRGNESLVINTGFFTVTKEDAGSMTPKTMAVITANGIYDSADALDYMQQIKNEITIVRPDIEVMLIPIASMPKVHKSSRTEHCETVFADLLLETFDLRPPSSRSVDAVHANPVRRLEAEFDRSVKPVRNQGPSSLITYAQILQGSKNNSKKIARNNHPDDQENRPPAANQNPPHDPTIDL